MQIKLNRKVFANALKALLPVLDRQNKTTTAQHVRLCYYSKKKPMEIVAANIHTQVRVSVEAKADVLGTLCLPARKLYKIVATKGVDDALTLAVEFSEEDLNVEIDFDETTASLRYMNAIDFPQWPGLTDKGDFELAFKAGELRQIIGSTLYAAGVYDTRYTLIALLVHIANERIAFVGMDGHRMSVMERTFLSAPSDEGIKIILARNTASVLMGLLRTVPAATEIMVTLYKWHVRFAFEGVEVIGKLIEGEYPDYTQVIPAITDKHHVITVDRMVLRDALQRGRVMSYDRSNAVRITVKPTGIMSLLTEHPDYGKVKTQIASEYEGKGFDLRVNSAYLLGALDSMHSEKVTLSALEWLDPILIEPVDDEAVWPLQAVVMPMRF
jgi:DNA polymerase-3 subunit beta